MRKKHPSAFCFETDGDVPPHPPCSMLQPSYLGAPVRNKHPSPRRSVLRRHVFNFEQNGGPGGRVRSVSASMGVFSHSPEWVHVCDTFACVLHFPSRSVGESAGMSSECVCVCVCVCVCCGSCIIFGVCVCQLVCRCCVLVCFV